MKIANVHELTLKQLDSGEKVQVLLGRHPQHQATIHHTIAVVELAAKLSSDPHFHKEREESYFIISGYGIAEIDDQIIQLKPGDLIFAKPRMQHKFINTTEEPLRYMVITAPTWIPEDSWES
ncbi:MAG: cupin domain-containing protein [Pseudobdellovibrionaceae bacterium]